MGLDQTIYVGLYLEAKKQIYHTEEWRYSYCENGHRFSNETFKYCPECGLEIKEYCDNIEHYHSFSEFHEKMFKGSTLEYYLRCIEIQSKYDYLIPNSSAIQMGDFLDENKTAVNEISINSKELIEQFKKKNAAILEMLAVCYDGIEVKWGTIVEWR